jgi:hypothetical protein
MVPLKRPIPTDETNAVWHNNWLLIGSLIAGVRNASVMSRVAIVLRTDLDAGMYLESVVTHMLRRTDKSEGFLPDRWKAAREYRKQDRRDKAEIAALQTVRRRFTPSHAKMNCTSDDPCSQSGNYGALGFCRLNSLHRCVCGVSVASTMLTPQG